MIDGKYGIMLVLSLISCDAFSMSVNERLNALERRFSDHKLNISRDLYEIAKVKTIAEVADVIKLRASKAEEIATKVVSQSEEIGEKLDDQKAIIDETIDKANEVRNKIESLENQIDYIWMEIDEIQKGRSNI